MKNWKVTVASAAMGAVALCMGGAAYATTAPGEQVGLNEASPLPEGVYFIDTNRYQNTGDVNGLKHNSLYENIPIIAWSTPWQILGARLEVLAAVPFLQLGGLAGACGACTDQVAPVGGFALAWNLGGGLSFSNIVLEYAKSDNALAKAAGLNVWTFRDTGALAYTMGGWTFLADGTINVTSDSNIQKNSFLYDLSALRTFGKWTVGAIAYGSTNIEGPSVYQNAAGAMVGYDFGPLTLQAYVAQDFSVSRGLTESTIGWTRVIIPLWNPAANESLK